MAGDDPGIDERLEWLETIAGALEAGEGGLATAEDLREEANEHLSEGDQQCEVLIRTRLSRIVGSDLKYRIQTITEAFAAFD